MVSRTSSLILLAFFMTIMTVTALPLSLRQEAETTEASPMPSAEATPETTTEGTVITNDDLATSTEETAEESSEEPVCVDEQYLLSKGHTLETMVHKQATVVNAFCPSGSLPCGTAHHMIRTADGSKLSYRQLCDQDDIQCSRRMVKVNSVLSHRWVEETHDNGLKLTMFDVRHPESIQKIVHAAIHTSRRVFG